MSFGARQPEPRGSDTRRTLRILVVSDLWPPYVIGGYELGAREVVTRLARRGHVVTVLTSTYGVSGPCREGDVHRLLFEEVYPRRWRPAEVIVATVSSLRRLRAARRFLRAAAFDVVYLFNPLGLTARFIEELCRTGRPAVAYVSDGWVAGWPKCDPLLSRWMHTYPEWPAHRRWPLAVGRVVARTGLGVRDATTAPIRHAQFVSRHIQAISEPKIAALTQTVIPWGVDASQFRYRRRGDDELGHWIFVGQIEEHKGPQVAIEAVRRLHREGRAPQLTLYGRDMTPFARSLQEQVKADGLASHVHFAGVCPRERLWAEAYDRAGLLVFGTLWDEPFSLTLLEAFSSGLPVLTTVTGGTGELVQDGVNATAYRTGDAEHLVRQWEMLASRPGHAATMAGRARALVERHLDIETMVSRVEAHLLDVCERAAHDDARLDPGPLPHPWETSVAWQTEPLGSCAT